jgi:biopolymer transport protein ExbD
VKLRRRYMTGRDVASVDVTAFLSLMVILVPFLLITAVFSRITILEFQSAAGDNATASARDPLQLTIMVRQDVIEVYHAARDGAYRLGRTPGTHELGALAGYLHELKGRFPDSDAATILLEPQVEYDTLVQVMDAVRIRQVRGADGMEQMALFPQIGLGDAPPAGEAP